jgi:23S rRNA pseudouridine1911/1915/1917 synthase
MSSKLDIIHEDESITVLNKPAGLVVNRSHTFEGLTLQDYLEDSLEIAAVSSTEFGKRVGIVHRLDKDTSGVILVAKTAKAFERLQRQFKDRQVSKEYVALIVGVLDESLIEVNAPIGRHPKNRFKFAVVCEGKPALTRIEQEPATSREVSLVHAYPKTGRTHQIRVHLAALGHPIVGDPIYSSKKQLEKFGEAYGRMMLHAHRITFVHPNTQEEVTFEAPIPAEFGIGTS